MRISLSDTGKRFNREWIFRHLNYELTAGHAYAITGHNGSGKSTLLQIIGGALSPSEGQITVTYQNRTVPTAGLFQHMAIAAPYLEVPEELTLVEFLQYHRSFKPLRNDISVRKIIEILGLEKAAQKQIRYYSSGMKQRVKLAQAIFSDVPLLLLDEPCTNLDDAGIALYHHLIDAFCKEKLIVVSSNDAAEYNFCTAQIVMADYK